MTTHIRVGAWVDETSGECNMGRIACGIDELPDGDKYVFEAESYAYHVADCQQCNPGGPKQYGTPISQLSGRPGHRGFEAFCAISDSWAPTGEPK
jgi:hypothetical protein